ncbi:MAG TPA: hypothetical protein VN650_06795, partial [Gemmatimonadaceae bacterium]|nr:hypothetical protein [Gemmatimonadaceae bacterium]
NLLLNVPPNRTALLDDVDVARLTAFSTELASQFGANSAAGARVSASSETAGHGARAAIDGDPDTWWSPRGVDRSPAVVRVRIVSSLGAPQIATLAVWPGRP